MKGGGEQGYRPWEGKGFADLGSKRDQEGEVSVSVGQVGCGGRG